MVFSWAVNVCACVCAYVSLHGIALCYTEAEFDSHLCSLVNK